MRSPWRVLVLLLVIGVIAFDLILDYRSRLLAQAPGGTDPSNPQLDLPVGTSVGELAPDFSGNTIDGQTVRLSDLRGKTVLINVFATWCGPCIAETPHLVEAFNVSGDDVALVGINLLESAAAVETFQRDFQVSYPLLLNQDGRLTDIYRPIGLPTSWFIDPKGVVQYVHAGPMTTDMILQSIEDVKEGRQPNPFATNT